VVQAIGLVSGETMRHFCAALFACILSAGAAHADALILPTVTGTITSEFGVRNHPILKRRILHKGIDFKARANDPLFSLADGTVRSAGRRGTFGNVVQIYFPRMEVTALYAHLNAVSVRPGQRVEQGEQIGLAGSTGRSTGPHLHFEIRNPEGKAINPQTLLRNAIPRTENSTESESMLADRRQDSKPDSAQVGEAIQSPAPSIFDSLLGPLLAVIENIFV
jgi:hypothetical protein